MRPADDWFNDYGESHQNPTNKTIHWICVPLILLTVLGMLWAAPVPAAMASLSSWVNWSTVVMVLALVYYFQNCSLINKAYFNFYRLVFTMTNGVIQ